MEWSNRVPTPDGRELQVCEWGPRNGGPVFVLHGTPGSRYLRHVQGEYQRRFVRAITYDWPGYGKSDRLPGRSVAQSAGDIATIADYLGLEEFAVLGISGGGPTALAAAAELPDRVTRCATVVGIGPYDAQDLDFYAGMSAEERQEWACAEQGAACLAAQFYQDSLAWAESLAGVEEILAPVRDMLVQAFREALLTPFGLVDDYAALLRPWGFDLASVACPTKVMIAQQDSNVPPAHGQWLVAHLTDAVAVLVDGGHLGPRDDAEEHLLGWLAETGAASSRHS